MKSHAPKAAEPRAGIEFRKRAGEMTRVEAFSDAVFAFAVTLLVVSLEVPHTFNELSHIMKGFFAFAICFTFLVWIWYQHARFFRRYGLEDPMTAALNGLLLFVVLFYVYPLKFLWSFLANVTSGGRGQIHTADGSVLTMVDANQGTTLMLIYGIGFTSIFFSLALLYIHAYRKRKELALNEIEIFDTKSCIWENVGVGGVGLLSMAIVGIGGPAYGFWAGICYSLIGAVKATHGFMNRKYRARLEAKVA